MTTALRVLLEPIIDRHSGEIGRYSEDITRALIATAPTGCGVAGVVPRLAEDERERLTTLLPGLAELIELPLPRQQLHWAWRAGLAALPGRGGDGAIRGAEGMLHSTGPVAPLARHDRVLEPGNQAVVTIHDITAWTHPDAIPRGQAALLRAMTKRAHRHADAVIAPSHAVAAQLNEIRDFGDRVRVIAGAPSPRLRVPVDADARAARLELPEHYIVASGAPEPRSRIRELTIALAHPDAPDLPLLIAGPERSGETEVSAVAAAHGLAASRVRAMGALPDADVAVLMSRATAFAYPGFDAGFALPMLEAFSLGVPVVHSDDASLVELAAGAGITVDSTDAAAYPQRLALALAQLADDSTFASRRALLGQDRARACSWESSAREIWQLHAEL